MPRIDHNHHDLIFIRGQQLDLQSPKTTKCRCGNKITCHASGYRCLYCDEWFCIFCAEEHFGQTREEWKAKQK